MLTNSNPDEWNENISLNGGIWDMNHKEQSPNPLHFFTEPNDRLKLGEYMNKIGYDRVTRQTLKAYTGMCFVFNSVRGLNFSNLTILNPVTLYLSHLFRDETHIALPTIGIMENTNIGILSAECVQQTNATGNDAPFIENNGTIDNLVLNRIDVGTDSLIVNEGIIKNIVSESIFSAKQN